MVLLILTLGSAGAFLFYAYETLCKAAPRREYERLGMGGFREFVGALQVLGAVGALVGLVFAPVGAVATAGLTLLMLLGLRVRYRLRDTPRLMMPAAMLAAINGILLSLHVF
ncbi:MAG: DoxX family protein [Acidimicrobiales bacterium]|nr:DoxX family protein [Acidimicrobiales bacterium]